MPRVFRICQRRHAALDGEGARLFGGRWSSPGIPVVYAAATLSLAALERFVGMDAEDEMEGLVEIALDVPDDLATIAVAVADLPKDWRATPAPEALALIGNDWVDKLAAAVLSVPSVVIPKERNYVLNPQHPAFGRIRPAAPEAFSYDPRMWKLADPIIPARTP